MFSLERRSLEMLVLALTLLKIFYLSDENIGVKIRSLRKES